MAAPAPKIDRQTTTPFLLRLFYSKGSFHPLHDFSPEIRLPKDQLQIYTWHSATLGELTHLLLTALPPSLNVFPSPAIGTRVSFRLVIADQNSSTQRGPARFQHRELGSVVVGGARAGLDEEDVNGEETAAGKRLEGDKDMSLAQGRFVIGDYVSCAILPPLPDGSVAAPPPPVSLGGMRGGPGNGFGGRGGPPRENGYGRRGDFGGRGEYGGFGRGRGRGDRFGDRDGGVPLGEWRRGEAPPGGPGGGGHWGRGRARGGGRGGW